MKHLFKPVYALLALLTLYFFICGASEIEWDSQGKLLAHNYGVWGDWSVHFTFISSILDRGVHWIAGDNPLFEGMPFQYPFLSHLITAFFGKILGTDTIATTYWVSLALTALLPWSLFRFYRELGLKDWSSLASTCFLLFIGGFQIFDHALSDRDPLTNQPLLGSVFTQFFIFEFFPQRAFLFGTVFFTLIMTWLLRKIKLNQIKTPQALVCAFLLALSSWLHMHTWIATGCLILFFFAVPPDLSTIKGAMKLNRKGILQFGSITLLFSALFVSFLLLRKTGDAQGGPWKVWFPGWAQNAQGQSGLPQEMNPIWFWLYNTGLFLPLALGGGFYLFRNRKAAPQTYPLLYPFFAAGSFLFIFALFINIQPHYYDNLKIITYSFIFLAPVAAVAIERIYLWAPTSRKKIAIGLLTALILLQSSTAISDLEFQRNHKHTTLFFSRDEMFLAEDFKALRSSPDALVLIAPRHNHWLPCLTGNPVVMGYTGWLWTWTINFKPREQKVQEILLGGPHALEDVQELKPEYIVINPNEESVIGHPVNMEFLNSHFPIVLQKYGWTIYSAFKKP